MSKALSGFLSINLLSFILLPGVIIHELSHMLIAVILFVPVGSMEFAPKKNGKELKLGSVEIGRTDPVRRAIIGFAPVFVGLMLVVGVVYLFISNILFFKDKDVYIFIALILGIVYLLFAISNTMFSSRADMEGTLEILITFLIIFAVAYILGFRLSLDFIQNLFTKQIVNLLQKSTLFLSVPIVIDVVLLGAIKIFKRDL